MHPPIDRTARFILFVFCLVATTAQAQVREWTGTTGSWFETGNWSGGVLPTDADRVEINNGGTARITAAGAVADTFSLADNFNSSGFLEVSGTDATFSVDATSTVGRSGPASMIVNAGAGVVLAGTLIVGDNSGTTATLTVSGANTSMSAGSLSIGRTGPGMAVLEAGAALASGSILIASSAAGQLRLDGAQTALTSDSFVSIEGNPPAGPGNPALLVSGGAAFNMTSPDNSFAAIDRGLARVTGAGSEWTIAGFLLIGEGGTGSLTIADGGRVSVAGTFNALGRFSGDVGVVNIGEGGAPGVFDINELGSSDGSAVVNFNHNATLYHFTRDGTATGTPVALGRSFGGNNITVNQTGPGTTVLAGAHFYTGATAIDAGELRLSGSAASAVTVNTGGAFSGAGNTTGAVSVNNNATLAPGDAGPGTLGTGTLTLAGDAQLNFELGDPGAANDRVQVNGDLTLDGVLNLTTLPGFVSGTFRLFDYTGTLTDNELEVTGVPNGVEASVDTSTSGQVNLVVITPEPAITIAPSSLDFGDVVVGETSPTLQVTITSSGTATLDINAVDAAAAPFARVGGTCPDGAFMLPVDDSCTLDYQYAPVDLVDSMQTITIDSNAPAGPDGFDLVGNAVAPELTVAPESLDFGDLEIGAPPAVLALAIENIGSGELEVGAADFTGPDADDFSVTGNTCAGPLAFGQTCTLEIQFDPAGPGVKQAVLEIDSNDPLAPTLVPLSGSRDVEFADGFELPVQP